MPPDAPRAPDVERIADLADLPLDEDDRDAVEAAMAEVLDAFALPDVEPTVEPGDSERAFEDTPRPWDRDEVEAILDQVPRREGRHIRG